jgi:hypothetical protein
MDNRTDRSFTIQVPTVQAIKEVEERLPKILETDLNAIGIFKDSKDGKYVITSFWQMDAILQGYPFGIVEDSE